VLSGEVLLIVAFVLLLLGAIVALFAGKLPRPDRTIAIIGGFCAGAAALAFALATPVEAFGDKFFYSPFARIACTSFCVLLTLWLTWISGRVKGRTREAVALTFFSVIGMVILVCAREFVTFLVAFELVAMPSYVLVGYWVKRRQGLEGALKYFVFSILTTTIMGYGISFMYAASASTMMSAIDLSNAGLLGAIGLMMLMVGMFTKVSAAPFHFWAPDAYDGAPAWTLAYVASVPKAGAMIAFVMVVEQVYGQSPAMAFAFAVIASVSMIVGSFAALTQEKIARILAYSSVVNAGYTLIALITFESIGLVNALFAALIFTLYYALAVMGILMITATEGEKVSDLAGLSKRRPVAAWGLVVLTLSLVGVPPLAGFFGKLGIFMAGMASPYWSLVILATVCSVASTFYYLRLVRAAFFDKEEDERLPVRGYHLTPNLCANIAVTTIVVLVCGVGLLYGVLSTWAGL
jgi:NADH-quinone oxidoreductase subunit N